ncbi:hypothetical protein PG985_012752 [Apiospora marii]|uniref:uncharacterized protein n=1 Tax=Apiospora marii TaxID=335849 RepID=UPI003130A4C2
MAEQSKNTSNDNAVDMEDEELKLAMAVLKVLKPGLKAADVADNLAAVAAKHGFDESYTKKRFDKIQASYADYKRKEPPKDIVIMRRQGHGKRAGASEDDDENTNNSGTPPSVPTATHTAVPCLPAPHVPHVSRRSQITARSARAAARAARDAGHATGENISSAAPSPIGTPANRSVPTAITAQKRKRDASTSRDAKRSKAAVADDGNGDNNQPEQDDA